MSGWNKISLLKFQQMQNIYETKHYDDQDKVFHNICVAYDIDPQKLNNGGIKNAAKLIKRFTKDFSESPSFPAQPRIKKYLINYEPGKMTLGQYITLSFYIARNALQNCHKILATISNEEGLKYDADTQDEREEYFLSQSITKIIGAIKLIQDKLASFNQEYKSLFGLGTDNADETESHPFHKRYGWIYSATMVADHNRITLDQAMALNVRVAFNDLAYLKSKSLYDEQQFKRK